MTQIGHQILSQLQAADVIPAPLPKQVTTTKEKKLPEPEILYPAVLIKQKQHP